MKTFLKAIGIIVAAAVALVVIAIIVVPLLVDPNEFKEEISARVKSETGRELKIVGDIDLSVFPWLGFELGRVEFGNAPGFEAPLFAATERVAIRIKLMPLIKREVEMDTLTVHGLVLNLEKNAAGKTNWEDLAKAGGKPEKPAEPREGTQLAAFAIGGLDVRDANISWRDAMAGQQFTVRNFGLETGALKPGKPVDIKLGFDLESAEPPMNGRVEGGGRLEVNADTQVAQASGLSLVARLKGEQLPGGETEVSLSADAVANGKQQTLSVPNLKLNAMGVNVSGKIDAKVVGGGTQYSGSLNVAEFSPRKLLEQLGQPKMETADPAVLSKASFNAGINGTDNRIALKPMSISLDDSNVKGEISVQNFAKPAIAFQLALDQIDADRYLPPPKEGETAAAPTPGAAASSAGGLPMETLRALDVNGKLQAGRLKVTKLTVTDFNATITAKNGLIKVSPASAKLYEGSYAGDIGLDARKDTPTLSLNEKLAGIQAGPLLKDLQGEEKLTGKGDVTVNVTAIGAEPESIKKTLNGNAAFLFRDGAIKGVNVGRMIREARAKLKGQTLPPSNEPEQTDFAELSGTLTFVNGLAKNQDLLVKSPLLRIAGAGQADLPSESVDYRVQAKVVGTTKGQGGKELAELSGVTIPIKVSGTFAQPKYGLDSEALGKALAESKAKQLIQEKLGGATAAPEGAAPAGDDIKEKAKGLLRGILGN